MTQPEPTTVTETDHADLATDILASRYVTNPHGLVAIGVKPENLALAQVHATLAVAQALRDVAEAIREGQE